MQQSKGGRKNTEKRLPRRKASTVFGRGVPTSMKDSSGRKNVYEGKEHTFQGPFFEEEPCGGK